MRKIRDVTYQAEVTGLPMDRTVFWRVVAVMSDGQKITTSTSTIQHQRQC
jgi:hypothetical protein